MASKIAKTNEYRAELQNIDKRALEEQGEDYAEDPTKLRAVVAKILRVHQESRISMPSELQFLCHNKKFKDSCAYGDRCHFSHSIPVQMAAKLILKENYKVVACRQESSCPGALLCHFYHEGDPERSDVQDRSLKHVLAQRDKFKATIDVDDPEEEDLFSPERPISPSPSDEKGAPPEPPKLTIRAVYSPKTIAYLGEGLLLEIEGLDISAQHPSFHSENIWGGSTYFPDEDVKKDEGAQEIVKPSPLRRERELQPFFGSLDVELEALEEAPRQPKTTIAQIVAFDLQGTEQRSIDVQRQQAKKYPKIFARAVEKAKDLFQHCSEALPNPHWKKFPCVHNTSCTHKIDCLFAHNFAVSVARRGTHFDQ